MVQVLQFPFKFWRKRVLLSFPILLISYLFLSFHFSKKRQDLSPEAHYRHAQLVAEGFQIAWGPILHRHIFPWNQAKTQPLFLVLCFSLSLHISPLVLFFSFFPHSRSHFVFFFLSTLPLLLCFSLSLHTPTLSASLPQKVLSISLQKPVFYNSVFLPSSLSLNLSKTKHPWTSHFSFWFFAEW